MLKMQFFLNVISVNTDNFTSEFISGSHLRVIDLQQVYTHRIYYRNIYWTYKNDVVLYLKTNKLKSIFSKKIQNDVVLISSVNISVINMISEDLLIDLTATLNWLG